MLDNPYLENNLQDGCRSKTFDSFNQDLEDNVSIPIAKAKALEAFLKNGGDEEFKHIVEDTFQDHFAELWSTVELVSMDDDDEEVDTEIPNLIPGWKMYAENGMNVLLIGPHGTGKTFSIQDIAKKLDLKMAYFSCSTLDPYTDLVGVPVPTVNEDGTKTLDMVRPHTIDECEFIFFDEFNRADSQTMNAVFEIIQFQTINGEPLPNLRMCWAAMNPADGDYTVQETDPALLDRFDAYIKMEPKPSVAYMAANGIDVKVSKALVRWWNAHDTKQKNLKLKKDRMSYISPRKLQGLGRTWMISKSGSAILRCLPPNGEYDSKKLIDMLETASGMKDDGATAAAKALGFPNEKSFIKSNFDIVGDVIKDDITQQVMVIETLFKGTGPGYIRQDYSPFIDKYCKASAVETVINGLAATKKSNLKAEYQTFASDKGVKDSLIYRALGL